VAAVPGDVSPTPLKKKRVVETAIKMLVRNLQGKLYQGDRGTYGRIIIKWTFPESAQRLEYRVDDQGK
jgi:hypothetical protein